MGEVVVTATRSHRLVKDQAVRVEVVPQEELEENSTVSPGNLSNLLNELAGARMDAGSAGLGGSALRLRGLPGRHAQILFDGLPLGGAQSDSFSMLQVPPVDLQRVELIKGVASALYGGSALAGGSARRRCPRIRWAVARDPGARASPSVRWSGPPPSRAQTSSPPVHSSRAQNCSVISGAITRLPPVCPQQ